MRFLIDESVGETVAQFLRDKGHDVLRVITVIPHARDSEILAHALREERIVVTNDKDFGELVFRSGQPHRGVVLFRLKDGSAANQVRHLAALLDQYADRLPGQFVVVTERGVRLRLRVLPASEEEGN